MSTFVKCELCDVDVPADKCLFAIHRRVIDGKEHFFCCAYLAEKAEKKRK